MVKKFFSLEVEDSKEEFDIDEDSEVDENGRTFLSDGPIDMFAENHQTVTVQTMQGYKSMLKWLYDEAGE
jgi:hypothetical protein